MCSLCDGAIQLLCRCMRCFSSFSSNDCSLYPKSSFPTPSFLFCFSMPFCLCLSPYLSVSDSLGASNEHRYCIATQDHALKLTLSRIPGVPTISVSHGTFVTDKPSAATLEAVEKVGVYLWCYGMMGCYDIAMV